MTVAHTSAYLPNMVVFKNLKKPPLGPFPKDTVVCATMKGVMTSDLMIKEYIPKVSLILHYTVKMYFFCAH